MDTRNVGGKDQEQISYINPANKTQIAGKTIKLAHTQTNTTQIDSKIPDAILQEKGAKKGFWGVVRTIVSNPVSAISCPFYIMAHIALNLGDTLSHPVKTLKEGFNDSLLGDKFNAAPTNTNVNIKKEDIIQQAKSQQKIKTPTQEEISQHQTKEEIFFDDVAVIKAEQSIKNQPKPMIDIKDVEEKPQQTSAEEEQFTQAQSGTKPTEIQQEDKSTRGPATIQTKIAEKDIKDSWSKSTFDDRRVLWASYNSDVKNMSPFWSKFLSWFQAIFTTKAETKNILVGRAVEMNAESVDNKQDIQQIIKAHVEREKENISELSNLRKEIQLEATIENAIIASRNKLKNAAELLESMKTIFNSPVTISLPTKEKSKLLQQLTLEQKKYAALQEKTTNNLNALKAQNKALYEKVETSLSNQ